MDALAQDLRYAWRQLAGSPGFFAVAILTLALGVGATTAIFSVAHAVLLRPLPIPEPHRLVLVWETNPDWGEEDRNPVSSGNFMDWRDQGTAFETLGAFSWRYGVGISGDDAVPERVIARRGTPGVFSALGVAPLHGRVPSEDDVLAGKGGVLLGHALWQRRYGGEPGWVGETIEINDDRVRVAAVLPPELDIPSLAADVWFPVAFDAEDRESRTSHQWQVLGRLAAGVAIEEAQAEMALLTDGIRARHPRYMEGFGVRVVSFRSDLVREVEPHLRIFLGLVAAVLLVACANVANLLLERGVTRRRELAIRKALGAGRRRLARQLFTESLLLAVIGGAAGVALALPATDALRWLAPADVPLLETARVDGTVLAVAAAASTLSTLLFGLLPAVRFGRVGAQGALRSTEATPDRHHGALQRLVLQLQVALCILLLVAAGLLFRSFLKLQAVEHGFDPRGLLAVSLDLPHGRYDGTAEQAAFYEALNERLRALPGVVAAAGTPEPPVVGYNNTFSFVIQGRPRRGPDPREDPVEVRAVTPGYFRTMEIPLRRGSGLEGRNRPPAAKVAVANESLVRRLWPGGGAVGARISFDDELPEGEREWIEIVGIATDTRHYGLDQPPEPALYIPYSQKRWDWMSYMTVLVRTPGDPLALAPAVRSAVWELDARLPIHRLAPVTELYAESHARRRFSAQLLALFAGLALLLGAIGVYGVVSYQVAQRRRELGIRMALGAEPRKIARSVVGEAMRVTAIGIVAGGIGAWSLAHLLEGLLFGISARDPVTFVAVFAVLAAATAAAAAIPARRAVRVDLITALSVD